MRCMMRGRRVSVRILGCAAVCVWALVSVVTTNYNYELVAVVEDAEARSSRSFISNATTTTSNNHTGSRPLLILHIGPHKTATSTIQCTFTFFQSLLREKGFLYLGRKYGECTGFPNSSTTVKAASVDTRRLVSCLDKHSTEHPCDRKPEWIQLERTLAALAAQNHTVMISDEAFSRMKINGDNLQLLHDTLGRHFRVHVAIVYRYYYSWLLSQYNEHYKPLPNRKFYSRWPGDDEGGSYMHPFVDWYARRQAERQHPENYAEAVAKGNYQLAADILDLHPARYLQKMWENYSSSVIIVNMHQEGDVTANFAREALPAPVFDVLVNWNGGKVPGRPNPSLNLDFDMLAVKGREMGLFQKSKRLARRPVAMVLEQVFDKVGVEGAIPFQCLHEFDVTQLLNRSLALERSVFPGQTPMISLERHESDFQQANQTKKFCNLDTEELLATDEVQELLRSLNSVIKDYY